MIHEYPSYRPPRTIRREQKERNRWERRSREMWERMDAKLDRGTFHSGSKIQLAFDERDLKRHGGVFRFRARPDLKRHPDFGGSRLEYERADKEEDESE